MTTYFVPYINDKPAQIELKGHKLLVVSVEAQNLAAELAQVGADNIKEMEVDDNPLEQSSQLAKLAESIKGGIVLAPPGISISSMLNSLEKELPWMQ